MSYKPELYEELKEQLHYSKDALDIALERQAVLYMQVSEAAVHASSAAKQASADAKAAAALTDGIVRAELEESLGKKPTEATVKNEVASHPDVLDAERDARLAECSSAEWAALRDAYSQRGHSLRELGNLWCANYFMTNAAGREDVDHKAGRERMAEARTKKKSARTRRRIDD